MLAAALVSTTPGEYGPRVYSSAIFLLIRNRESFEHHCKMVAEWERARYKESKTGEEAVEAFRVAVAARELEFFPPLP